MRGATQCAPRVKELLRSLRAKLGKVSRPAVTDPISQIVLGIFSRDMPESKAREALDLLRGMVVDYNELRVIPPVELAAAIGEYPDAWLKCEDLSRALNRIFAVEHAVSIDHLAAMSARDVRAYLNRVDGLEPYTRARVRLLGFQQHAVPLDEAMWEFARRAELVDPRCPLEEAQQFLERQIAESDGVEFFALLKKHAWAEVATAVRKGETERIRSVPPDRTSQHMLRRIAEQESGQAPGPGLAEEEPEVAEGITPPFEAEPTEHDESIAPPRAAGGTTTKPDRRRAKTAKEGGRNQAPREKTAAESRAARPAAKRTKTDKGRKSGSKGASRRSAKSA